MSVRQALLSLLDLEPMYGYQLRTEFEARTGSTWPLNVGQVYTTLARLERDGLVEEAGTDDEGHAFYNLTPDGRGEAMRWFETPVERTPPPRNELAIKLALAVTLPGIDVIGVIDAQRTDTVRQLQDYVRLKTRGPGDDLAWLFVIDSLIYHAEAEVRWLDHCEQRFRESSRTAVHR